MQRKQFERTVKLNRSHVLWVIIPCRNEEEYIVRCLDSFKKQTDKEFRLLVVDNGSTDRTVELIVKWEAANWPIEVRVLKEQRPGTSYACREGISYACMKHAAHMIARTDADSVVDPEWVSEARTSLIRGAEFVGGKLKVQNETWAPMLAAKWKIHMIILRWLVIYLRINNRMPFSTMLMPGGNMAFTAEAYQEIGGFSVQAGNEDVDLNNRLLALTPKGRQNNKMIVYTSPRRVKELGVLGTLRWYIKKEVGP